MVAPQRRIHSAAWARKGGIMKLRQVAIAARQLEPYRSQLFDVLGVPADFKDPGVGEFGLENSVMALGDAFFEIVAPVQSNTAAGRTLDRAGVDACGYMLLFQVDNYAEFDAHLLDLQLRKVWEVDRDEVSACHVHPKDMRGAIVSFDEMRPPASWIWGGPDWQAQRANHCSGIAGCTMSGPDPEALAQHWATILRRPAIRQDDGLRIALDDNTFVAFTAGSDEPRLSGMTLSVDDVAAAEQRAADAGLQLGNFAVQFAAR